MGKLFKNPKVLVALIAALAVFLVALIGGALGAPFGGGFLGSPVPHIQLAAESVVQIGGYSLNNTTIMFWATGVLLLFLAWRATRRMTEVPGRLQSLFEAIVEFFDSTADSVAGGARQGRRFLPVVLGIFLIVLCSNWLGVLPGVGTIGRIEPAGEFYEHRLEKEIKKTEEAAAKQGKHPSEIEVKKQAYLNVRDEKVTVFSGTGPGIINFGQGEAAKAALYQIVDLGELDTDDPAKLEKALLNIEDQLHQGKVRHGPDQQRPKEKDRKFPDGLIGKHAGILVPYLRGSSTDPNTTLAVAIVAMFSVQLWGMRALGGRTYAGKFFVNPLKAGPIMMFVGFLEAFGEIARTISFTFRLFGNMFAGEVLLIAMGFLLPLIGIIPFLGLELFVGLIQAFVFAMLTLVFGVSASAHHSEERHEEARHAEESAEHAPRTGGMQARRAQEAH